MDAAEAILKRTNERPMHICLARMRRNWTCHHEKMHSVSGVEWTFPRNSGAPISLMSAFPETGRSIPPENGEIKVRFRPEAELLVRSNIAGRYRLRIEH